MKDHIGCTTAMFQGDLAAKLDAMRQAGFGWTEVFSRDIFENLKGPEYALDLIRDSGLGVSCLQMLRDFEGCAREAMPRKLAIAEHVMDQAQWLGTDLLILCASVLPDASGDPEQVANDLSRLADLARSRGLRIAYEPIAWATWFSDYRAAWRLVERINHPHLGLLLDSTHMGCLKLPFDDVRLIAADKVFLVELADLPGSRLDHVDLSRHYRLLPGHGVLALERFVQALDAIGYQGVYSLETFNDHYRQLAPAPLAEAGYRAVRELLRRAREPLPAVDR
jgi:4-hydroxyphenylpyruvate dioxygenase